MKIEKYEDGRYIIIYNKTGEKAMVLPYAYDDIYGKQINYVLGCLFLDGFIFEANLLKEWIKELC